MIKDWSKLVNLLPKEIEVDEFNRPLKRGIDVNQIINVMYTEYKFRVKCFGHGMKCISGDDVEDIDEMDFEVDYTEFELWFTNDEGEQVIIYMYGKNINDLAIYDICYEFSLCLGNNNKKYVCATIYKPIGIFTPTYNY